MSSTDFTSFNILIVDDFNNFRLTLNKIVYELGFRNIDSVGSAEEAITLCRKSHYHLILCDYNLGMGKNGQQLLEELRLEGILKSNDIFILLSAETSRNVVMSAYDCEPDAYLTKPVTIKIVRQRLQRLIDKRKAFIDINISLDKAQYSRAIQLLLELMEDNSRYNIDCQKMLAEIYLSQKEYDKAESVYRSILEIRSLAWAQVGLAEVKLARGDVEKSIEWLKDIIKENPSFMKAYDVMSLALEKLNKKEALQKNLEEAVNISPLSLSRQVYLAETAMHNGDAVIATQAYRKVIKNGGNTHHVNLDNQLKFAQSIHRLSFYNEEEAKSLSKEAGRYLDSCNEEIEGNIRLKSQLLICQMHAIQGEKEKACQLLDEVLVNFEFDELEDIDIQVEVVKSLESCQKFQDAKTYLNKLVEIHRENEPKLEKIDPLLMEPVSVNGKKQLARINKKGIESYKDSHFDKSIDSFFKAEKKYPRYIGIKLNLVQAMIAKLREDPKNEQLRNQCVATLSVSKKLLSVDSSYMKRLNQLESMLAATI